MTGPAQGAQTSPVATPRSTDAPAVVASFFVRAPAQSASRDPSDTSGAIMRSAKAGNSIANPNSVITARAAVRPWRFTSTAQPPATAASVVTAAKVRTRPASNGKPPRLKGLVGARQYERQDRKDARRCNREQAGEIGKDEEHHRVHPVEVGRVTDWKLVACGLDLSVRRAVQANAT